MKLSGTVVHGKGKGRLYGMPTANLRPFDGEALPAEGVWAVEVLLDGRTYRGLTNVGPRPTVDDNPAPTVETMLLDFDEEIYGKTLTITFLERIRPVMRFSGLDALRRQISLDIEKLEKLEEI